MSRASALARRLIWVGLLVLPVAVVAPGCGRTESDSTGSTHPDGSAGTGATAGSGGVAASGGTGGGAAGAGGSSASGGTGGGVAGASGSGGTPTCGACSGCCDVTGQCLSGDQTSACGKGGVVCFDCGSIGFGCVGGQCEGPPPKCGPSTCSGCCDAAGVCHLGGEQDACGLGGGVCADCTASGQGCVSGQCAGKPPSCGPGTCAGCCDAQGQCQPGQTSSSCGADGVSCAACVSPDQCWASGSYCAYVPTCGPLTCPSGCCDANGACQNGLTNSACGGGGQACADCNASGQACSPLGFCYTGAHCGPDTCAGCCDATGQCHAGSDNAACGQYGTLCQNCANQGQSCVGQVCSSGSTCPAAYPGCAPNAATPPPATSVACSSAEITAVGTACKGSGTSPACGAAFQTLLSGDPACYDCLTQFATDQAYVRCLAPFLGAACNHDLTCAVECSNTACNQCPAGAQSGCQSGVFDANGECRSFVNGYYCAQAAISGPGAFCDFSKNDVGAWFQSVGTHYCGGK